MTYIGDRTLRPNSLVKPLTNRFIVAKFVLLALLAFGGAELYLLVKTGQWFGAWFPVLGVFLGLAAGGFVIRHEGLKSINRLKEAMRTGLPPGGAAGAGLAGIGAGFLFMLPGFLSDAMALLLLTPWTRSALMRTLYRRWRVVETRHGVRRRGPGGPVIEAEAIEVHGPGNDETRSSPWKR